MGRGKRPENPFCGKTGHCAFAPPLHLFQRENRGNRGPVLGAKHTLYSFGGAKRENFCLSFAFCHRRTGAARKMSVFISSPRRRQRYSHRCHLLHFRLACFSYTHRTDDFAVYALCIPQRRYHRRNSSFLSFSRKGTDTLQHSHPHSPYQCGIFSLLWLPHHYP